MWRLKVEATAMPLSWRGRLLQASGPDTKNERWPNPESTLHVECCSLRFSPNVGGHNLVDVWLEWQSQIYTMEFGMCSA